MIHTGRPFSQNLRADWKLSIDASLAAEVDLLLEDHVTRKPKYGARSRLVQALLREYLAREKGLRAAPTPSLQQIVNDEERP